MKWASGLYWNKKVIQTPGLITTGHPLDELSVLKVVTGVVPVSGEDINFCDGSRVIPGKLRAISTDAQGPISLMTSCLKLEFNGNFTILLFSCWPSDCNKSLHMPRQYSCCGMCKIWYFVRIDVSKTKLPLILSTNRKIISKMDPWTHCQNDIL